MPSVYPPDAHLSGAAPDVRSQAVSDARTSEIYEDADEIQRVVSARSMT